jgi:putative transposase
MSRIIIFSDGEYYHIYNRGVDKRLIFMDKGDYERFVKLLYLSNGSIKFNFYNTYKYENHDSLELKDIDRGKRLVDIGAWCLMPNHFHLLIHIPHCEAKPHNEDDTKNLKNQLSIFMHKLLTGYSMYFNRKYNRKGRLFETTFMAKHLNTDQYLKYQYAYIHLNPIGIMDKGWKSKKILNKTKAKKFLSQYKYSSYLDYFGVKREEDIILNKSSFPDYFPKIVDFENMISEWINFDSYEVEKK